jgi:hypothetical protein
LEKIINQIISYSVEEGPGRASEGPGRASEGPSHGSEDIKKQCNVKCFDFLFFLVFMMDVMGGKITVNLKELH